MSWEYYFNNCWNAFNVDISTFLESCYLQGAKSVPYTHPTAGVYIFDLTQMVQYLEQNKSQMYPIRRSGGVAANNIPNSPPFNSSLAPSYFPTPVAYPQYNPSAGPTYQLPEYNKTPPVAGNNNFINSNNNNAYAVLPQYTPNGPSYTPNGYNAPNASQLPTYNAPGSNAKPGVLPGGQPAVAAANGGAYGVLPYAPNAPVAALPSYVPPGQAPAPVHQAGSSALPSYVPKGNVGALPTYGAPSSSNSPGTAQQGGGVNMSARGDVLYTQLLNDMVLVPVLPTDLEVSHKKLLKYNTNQATAILQEIASTPLYAKGVTPPKNPPTKLVRLDSYKFSTTVNQFSHFSQKVVLTNASSNKVNWQIKANYAFNPYFFFAVTPSSGTLDSGKCETLQVVVVCMDVHKVTRLVNISCDFQATPGFISVTPLSLEINVSSSKYKFWKIPVDKLNKLKKIGEGGFASVWLAECYGVKFAAKVWPHNGTPPEDYTSEINILEQVRHPNLIGFLGSNDAAPEAFILTEFAANKSLDKFYSSPPPNTYNYAFIVKFALGAAQGLAALHARNIVHRDIKSMNILVSDQYEAKVADFGIAKPANLIKTAAIGSAPWVAPEVLSSNSYSISADVFSFGLVLLELGSRSMPNRTIAMAVQGDIPIADLGKDFISKFKEYTCLILLCCEPNPAKRPTMAKVVELLSMLNDVVRKAT